MDGWMDGWNGMETLFNHGSFIKFYTYMSIYIKSALPKSRASNLLHLQNIIKCM